MEPVTLAVVLTLLVTKATEKVGEQMGEGAIAAAKHLLSTLKKRSPDTAKRLEAAPEPTEENVIDVEIIQEVQQAAANDPEVKAAVDRAAAAMKQQVGTVANQTQLAEKIGILIQGGYNPIKIEKFEV